MILENKLDITNPVELAREEERISKTRAKEMFETGYLETLEPGTFETLRKIHKHLFEEIYEFAGDLRKVNIAKGNFRFTSLMYLEEAIKNIDIQTMEIWEHCSISEGRERDYVKDGTLIFGVETREVLELCTPLDFQGKECIISRVECRIEGKELLNAYELVEIRNIRTAEKLHKEISGVSLEGVVHRVVQDQIQISFGQDTTEPEVWFPYATVYSSPDGAGWYCMPEKGDAVRVYFPDCDERKGIAISSIHLACDLRENPDVKYIRSPYDKEIRFDSSAIRITNNQGMSVILDDKEGILLESNGNIIFSAGGDIEIQSGRELNIIGCEGISICQGDNEIEIKDGIRQTANKIWQR